MHLDQFSVANSNNFELDNNDPLIEISNIIRESNDSFNNIIEHFVPSLYPNCQLLIESSMKDFFENVAIWFRRLFQSLSEAISEAIKALDIRVRIDKKIVQDKSMIDRMISNKNNNGQSTISIHLKTIYSDNNPIVDTAKFIMTDHYKVDDIDINDEDSNDFSALPVNFDEWKGRLIDDIARNQVGMPLDDKSLDGYKTALTAKYIGNAEDVKYDDIDLDDIIEIIKSGKDTTSVKQLQKSVETSYRTALQEIDRCRKLVSNSTSYKKDTFIANMRDRIQTQKLYKQIDAITLGVALKYVKLRFETAHKLIHKWLGNKAATNENAGIFSSLAFI